MLLLCYCLSFFDLQLRIPLLISSHTFSICCYCNLVISAFMAYRLVCSNSIMTVLLEEHELLPSGAHVFTPSFKWGFCCSILVFCILLCRSLCILMGFFSLLFAIVLSTLPFTLLITPLVAQPNTKSKNQVHWN